jgi:hypothetical protein
MKQIPDDPIVRCIERSGYPPWMQDGGYDPDDWEEVSDGDVFYGNSTPDF